MNFDIEKIDFRKTGGLVPAIIQHAYNQKILMLGYMNAQALAQTLVSKQVTFYSRSRNCLWVKGETSGHYLNLITIHTDCDYDTLLIHALPDGPVCHTGTESCFATQCPQGLAFLTRLEALIKDRKTTGDKNSYTAQLLQAGLTRIAQKVGEEAVETALAAITDNNFNEEVADLLYHLLVLLAAKGQSLNDIAEILQARHAHMPEKSG